MGQAIGEILGFAVGVAISPVPIIAVILMLFSRRATVNSLVFLIGWLIGLLLVGFIVLSLGVGSDDGEPSSTSGWLKVVIGALFLLLAVRQWRSRPAPGAEASPPGWMDAIDDFTAVRSFGIAVLLSAVNPKNLGLTVAAAATISTSGLSTGDEYVVLVVFVAIASATVAAPVALNLVLGERAEAGLGRMKEWLVANNATVMTVLFVVLGAKILGDGITALA